MPRTNGWIHDFDPDNVPNNYTGISFSDVVNGINTHQNSSKHISYGSAGLSINTLRDHQYKHVKGIEQSSSTNNIKMSNFRRAWTMGLYVKIKNEQYPSQQDTGKIRVRIAGGTGGTYQAAAFTNWDGTNPGGTDVRDIDAKIHPADGAPGTTVQLDPDNTYKKWSEIPTGDKVTITSSIDEFEITSLGNDFSSTATQFPIYKVFVHDLTAGDDLCFMSFDIYAGLIGYGNLYPRNWGGGAGSGPGSAYRQFIYRSTDPGGIDNTFNSGIIKFPGQYTDGSWSNEILLVHPGMDGIM